MSNYIVKISSIIQSCPFDYKKKSKAYCQNCKAFLDPCKGIGTETVITEAKVSREKMGSILGIIKSR